jgi:hypothetical protein
MNKKIIKKWQYMNILCICTSEKNNKIPFIIAKNKKVEQKERNT